MPGLWVVVDGYKTKDMTPEDFRNFICDRFTPEELIEFLGVTVEEVFEAFYDKCYEIDLEDL